MYDMRFPLRVDFDTEDEYQEALQLYLWAEEEYADYERDDRYYE